MGRPANRARLEAALGHTFSNPALLDEALTHASAGGRDNQRLEFLGDALLSAAVAALIHRLRPDWEEGAMSKLRTLLVRTETLAAWAEELGLELKESLGRTRARMGAKPRADALEAILGAVFLDAGEQGFQKVSHLVDHRFATAVRDAHEGLWAAADPKTTLQERAASLGLPAPAYTLISQDGPGHAPRFTVRAEVTPHAAVAEGGSRKGAEAEAARLLLAQLPASRSPRRV